MDVLQRMAITSEQLADFCRRWQVQELALFGSVLRDDFTDESDIDVLVVFERTPDFNNFINMQIELSDLMGREVDLVIRKNIENDDNYLRRKLILNSAKTIYAKR